MTEDATTDAPLPAHEDEVVAGRSSQDAADASDDDVEPAFAMDLDPEDQGTAEAAAESSG